MNAVTTQREFDHFFHGTKSHYAEENTVTVNAVPDVKMNDFMQTRSTPSGIWESIA